MKVVTKRPDGSKRVQTINEEPTLTQQQFKDEVNINNIVKKYKKTGQWTHLHGKTGTFADFSELPSYQDALHTVMKADESFMQLPSTLRTKFNNNPQELITYLSDPKNIEESIQLGLRQKPTPTPTTPQQPSEPQKPQS